MTLCAFKGMEMPCVAEAKTDSPRSFCGPHEAMLRHDYALAYRRRIKRQSKAAVDHWVESRGLDVSVLVAEADKMTDTTKPLTVRTVGDVDSL